MRCHVADRRPAPPSSAGTSRGTHNCDGSRHHKLGSMKALTCTSSVVSDDAWITEGMVQKVVGLHGALAHSTRLRIVRALSQNREVTPNVGRRPVEEARPRRGTMPEPGNGRSHRWLAEFATFRESNLPPSPYSQEVSGSSRRKTPAKNRLRSVSRLRRGRESAISPQPRRRTTRLMTRKRPANAGLSRSG